MESIDKCPHGIYLAGEQVARYCNLCSPRVDRTLNLRLSHRPHKGEVTPQNPALGVDRFMNQPAGARLAFVKEFSDD